MLNKNILVLSPTPSHPQDAGNRKRIFALTKYLQELGATIYFVYCPREWDREIPQDAYDGMNKCWDYFFVAYPVQPAVHRTDDEYFEIDAWWDVGIEYSVNWIKLSSNIDLVLCNYVFYSKVLELFDESVTKVVDTHDITSNRNYLLDRKLGYRDFFYVSPESEKKALDRAHLVLSIKEDESSWFKCLSQTPVLTIGHLEPEPSEIIDREIDYSNIRLGFIGSANPINVKNLESFLDEYLALYSNYTDKFTFVVGGKVCNVLDSRFHDQVEIIGMVDDVSEFYQQIDIIVLPFEFSTGLKIKTVEALSWSKPCMGTVNAFEGLGSNCKYHSFETIKELASGIRDLVHDSKSFVLQLEQDSKLVYSNYSSKVKKSIEKLYSFDWKSIKEFKASSNYTRSLEIIEETQISQQKYNFNILSNIDFWDSNTNEAAWINWWINNARQLGNVNIYRTQEFKNIDSDKLVLYKHGLVNNVHLRELYQIIDIFKISPDENQIFINLLDFNSIIYNHSCLQELEHLQLADNHFLWYFFIQLDFSSKDERWQYAHEILSKTHEEYIGFCFGNLNSKSIAAENVRNHSIVLANNPITLNPSQQDFTSLEKIVIGTSCLDPDNASELDKLVLCCRDFLPHHFELLIFSDSNLVTNEYAKTHSFKNAETLIHKLDLFICIEEPASISFLIYLCICQSVPIYYKEKQFTNNLVPKEIMKPINNFTSIPEVYKSFLKTSVLQQEIDSKSIRHKSWNLFVEYLVIQAQKYSMNSKKDYSIINQ